MEKLEIYFSDLTPEAQKRYLDFQGEICENGYSCDFLPIFIIERD